MTPGRGILIRTHPLTACRDAAGADSAPKALTGRVAAKPFLLETFLVGRRKDQATRLIGHDG